MITEVNSRNMYSIVIVIKKFKMNKKNNRILKKNPIK